MMQGEVCVSRLAVLTPRRKSTERLKLFQKLSRSCGKAPRRRLWRWLCEPFDNFLAAQYCAQCLAVMETPRDPAASRYEHAAKGLRRSDLDPDPIKQFGNWFTAAIEAGIRDVNAMSLATAGADGRPSVRIVLLKGFDQDGFVFFTNYESEKGKQLDANPYVALAFYWIELDRQIRISGKPDMIEFWQGRPNRMHDRFRYSRQKDSGWLIERLAP